MDWKRLEEEIGAKIHPGGRLLILREGDEKGCLFYEKQLRRKAKEFGISVKTLVLDGSIEKGEFLRDQESSDGVLFLQPMSDKILHTLLPLLDSMKDVDGMHPLNRGRISTGEEEFLPATVEAILFVLERFVKDMTGRRVLIVNRSHQVGVPLALSLIRRGATVTVGHSKSKELEKLAREAEILIVGMGNPSVVTKKWLHEKQVVIDVGMAEIEGKMCGDVPLSLKDCVKFLAPSPGGIGRLTTLTLLRHVSLAAKKRTP